MQNTLGNKIHLDGQCLLLAFWTFVLTLMLTLCIASAAPEAQAHVEQWGCFELTLKGPAGGNPYRDVTLAARFTQGQQQISVDGFYDGDGVYRIRFMPPSVGSWRYETTSNRPELQGRRGTLTAVPPSPGNHGPVRVHKTYHFAYADGTPYLQVGTTCYVWTHQAEAIQQQTLQTLPYKLDLIDPWAMTVTSLGSAQPGEFVFTPRQADRIVRLTAYKPGQAIRPEVKASVSPTEGLAPLTVRFATQSRGQIHWDFGDGSTSRESNPIHTYMTPGLYTATITLTDKQGTSSSAIFDIAADRDATKPIVLVGSATGESAPLKLNGTARRGQSGSLILSQTEPWGWVSVGQKPLPELEGLRSFTICGWVKPASLQTGSGGNRIAFNLNTRSAGFDLVHLADGRLRLSVNEWPDGVKNDSSPKLRVGEWTFFAVTYNATKPTENVHWYFGTESQPAELDRITTYNAGPTGIGGGPLTIGNYNETMHGYGLDRQFRGEIRDLRSFCSRFGPRGVLTLEQIRSASAQEKRPLNKQQQH